VNDDPQITPEQAKAARSLLGLGKKFVYRELGIAPQTLERAEIKRAKRGPLPAMMINRLRRYYESAGVEFTNGGQPGVRLGPAQTRDSR
jgi:hypothetical protein